MPQATPIQPNTLQLLKKKYQEKLARLDNLDRDNQLSPDWGECSRIMLRLFLDDINLAILSRQKPWWDKSDESKEEEVFLHRKQRQGT